MNLNEMAEQIFENNYNVGWWNEQQVLNLSKCKNTNKYNYESAETIGCKIALCHSELSEALEGMRKGLMDDHLPHRPMVEVELADTIIRILDLAGFLGIDIDGAIKEKLEYNASRADHKLKNREAEGGKTI